MSSSAPLADCAFARCGIARLASPADAVRRNSLRLIVIWSCSRTRTLPRGPVVVSQEQDRGQARDWLKSGQFHKTWRNDLAHAVSLGDERVPPVIRMASAGPLRTANICGGCNADIGPSGKPNLESMTVLTARMLLQTRAVKSPCSGAQWRFLVLPVRIELTTSPLPRARSRERIYLILRNFCPVFSGLGAHLVLHPAKPASIDGASCDTLTCA